MAVWFAHDDTVWFWRAVTVVVYSGVGAVIVDAVTPKHEQKLEYA